MNTRILTSAILLLMTTGCISQEQARWERDNREIAECQRLGYQPNTERMANCRLQLRMIDAQEDQAKALRNQRSYHHNFVPLTEDYYKSCKTTSSGNTICKNW